MSKKAKCKITEKVEIVMDESCRGDLIDLVFAKPVLWDMSNPQYAAMRQKDKDKVGATIAEELHMDVQPVKDMWRNTRTYFNRELKKCMKHSSGDGGEDEGEGESELLYTGTWVHFHKLKFLINIVKPRKTSGNLPSNISTDESNSNKNTVDLSSIPSTSQSHNHSQSLQDNSQNFGYMEEMLISDDETEHVPDAARVPDSGKENNSSSKKKRSLAQRAVGVEEKKCKLLEQRENLRALENDEDFQFCNSLLPHLRMVTDKLILRGKLLALVQEHLKGEKLERLSKSA